MNRFVTLHLVCSLGIAATLAACSKTPKTDPCELVTLGEAQSLDGAIVKAQAFPPKKGDAEELCMYYDAGGAPKVMLFVWRGETSDPREKVSAGMQGAADRVVDVSGVGDKAVAGFSADGDVLKLFAVQAKGATLGFRVREPVKEGDARYASVKSVATHAVSRLK